jgi:hypothetical protein
MKSGLAKYDCKNAHKRTKHRRSCMMLAEPGNPFIFAHFDPGRLNGFQPSFRMLKAMACTHLASFFLVHCTDFFDPRIK